MRVSDLAKKQGAKKRAVSAIRSALVRRARVPKVIDVDERIPAMAKRGELVRGGEKAFNRSLKKGLSVIVVEDGAIYKVHPDGTRTRLKKQRVMYRDNITGKFYQK